MEVDTHINNGRDIIPEINFVDLLSCGPKKPKNETVDKKNPSEFTQRSQM